MQPEVSEDKQERRRTIAKINAVIDGINRGLLSFFNIGEDTICTIEEICDANAEDLSLKELQKKWSEIRSLIKKHIAEETNNSVTIRL